MERWRLSATVCVVCLLVGCSQLMSVDAVVSYHGQRAQSTTRSPAHITHHDDDDVRRQRPREHAGTRRTQVTRSGASSTHSSSPDFSVSSSLSHPFGDLDFSINWQTSFELGGQRAANAWWNGPNVCVRTTESFETRDNNDDDNDNDDDVVRRHHHHFAMSTVCDDSDTVYKCSVTRSFNGNTTRISRIYECCHGYKRTRDDEHGCTQREELRDLVTTLRRLNATEMIRAADAAGLRSSLATDNITVFAPINAAFDALHPPTTNSVDSDNVVVITPQLVSMAHDLRRVVSAHVVPGFLRSADFDDDVLLDTSSAQTTIRLNVFRLHDTIVTANCRRVLSVDHSATNGVIHLVNDVLRPVTSSVAHVIRNTPQLSHFAQLVDRVGLWDKLPAIFGRPKDLTVFAPSNDAFNQLPAFMRHQLLGRHDNNACITNFLLHHVVYHVICSTAVQTAAYTINALGNRVNLTRHGGHDADADDDGDRLMFNAAAVTSADLMATDGVVHVIDQLFVPHDALSLTAVADQVGASSWLSLVHKAKMDDSFNELRNFTAFLPTNEAFKQLTVNVTELWEDESTELRRMLQSHVAAHHRLNSDSFYNNLRLETINSEFINFNVLHSFPFADERLTSVQCAAVVKTDIRTCSGVVHLVDKVMLPPAGDILDVLYQHAQFSRLVSFLKAVNFAEAFQSEDEIVTFFAPTNQAFSSLPSDLVEQLTQDPDTAQLIIQHHIIRGAMCCSTMSGSRWFLPHHEQTVDGHWLSVRRRHNRSTVDGVAIQSCDVVAHNGLVHAVDSFLPSALRHHLPRRAVRRRRQRSDIWTVLDRLLV